MSKRLWIFIIAITILIAGFLYTDSVVDSRRVPLEPVPMLDTLDVKVIPLQPQKPRIEAPVTPKPTPAPVEAFSYRGGPLNQAQITFLGNCESGMTASTNTGNGYYGAYQFSIPTWNAMGTGYARADLAPLSVQTAAVQKLLSGSSIFTQFPGCANQMVANGLL